MQSKTRAPLGCENDNLMREHEKKKEITPTPHYLMNAFFLLVFGYFSVSLINARRVYFASQT
jgi:hypothetical protein